MSLAKSWEEFRTELEAEGIWMPVEIQLVQRAFYAGAEACLDHPGNPNEIQAEIDHFSRHK